VELTPMYQRIAVDEDAGVHRVTLNRPDRDNAIDPEQLCELHAALDRAERSRDCAMVLVQHAGQVFSAGMDFTGVAGGGPASSMPPQDGATAFYRLLRRLTQIGCLVVASVDGRVSGGGVGIVAASDVVLATPRSEFSLPEALWGLLPCCVLPFLIRRVGFQKAYTMALTTQPVPASEAHRYHLVDELAERHEARVRRLLFRATRLPGTAIGDAKRYFSRIWPLGLDAEELAVGELGRLMSSQDVRDRISGFVVSRRLPWEG